MGKVRGERESVNVNHTHGFRDGWPRSKYRAGVMIEFLQRMHGKAVPQ